MLFSFSGLLSCAQKEEGSPVEGRVPLDQPIQITTIHQNKTSTQSEIDSLFRAGNTVLPQDVDSAIEYYREALASSYDIHYTKGIARGLIKLGSSLFDEKREYSASYELFHAALPYSLSLKGGADKLLSSNYNCLGNVAFVRGQYDSALHFYLNALDALQNLTKVDTPLTSLVYSNIGSTFGQMAQYEKAAAYISRSMHWAREKDSLAMARGLSNLAIIYAETNQADSAIRLWGRAISIFRDAGRRLNLQDIYNKIAVVYLRNKDTLQASFYLDSAVASLPDRVWNDYGLLQNLGCVHYFNGELSQALPYYLRSLELCEDNAPITARLNIYQTLADIYHSQGKSDLAYANQKAYSDLQDSLLNLDKIAVTNQLEVKYRVAEKDKRLAQSDLKITRQYLWLIGIGSLAVVVVLMLLSRLRKKRHAEEVLRLKAMVQGEEQERGRMARELHDGIMSRMYALKLRFEAIPQHSDSASADFHELAEELEQSIAELRSTAHNLLPEILKQEGLVGALQLFCDRISQQSVLQIDFQLTGTMPQLAVEQELGIYRIVQELVQNIMKHADATQGLVQLTSNADWLTITVDDNGKGMPELDASIDKGIGLRNLRQRVQALDGTMEIENNGGTSVYLEFNLKSISGQNNAG